MNGGTLAINGGSLAYLFANSEQLGVFIAAAVPLGYLTLEVIKTVSGEILKWRQELKK